MNVWRARAHAHSAFGICVVTFVYSIGFKFMVKPIKMKQESPERLSGVRRSWIHNNSWKIQRHDQWVHILYVNSFCMHVCGAVHSPIKFKSFSRTRTFLVVVDTSFILSLWLATKTHLFCWLKCIRVHCSKCLKSSKWQIFMWFVRLFLSHIPFLHWMLFCLWLI